MTYSNPPEIDFMEKTYNFIVNKSVKIVSKLFPKYYGKQPLAPTDRYIEYPFAIRNLPKLPARILDIGCAGSFFPLELAAMGYEVWGVDRREYSIIDKIKFGNFYFVHSDILDYLKDSMLFWDAITCVSTLEHIGIGGRHGEAEKEDKDLEVIEYAKARLIPEGLFILTIPYGKARIIPQVQRIYDYNRVEAIKKGFVVIAEEYYGFADNGGWYPASRLECEISNVFMLCCLALRK
jgi:SAM-dependent methyltransferase